jgi:uncharacterized membrane protein
VPASLGRRCGHAAGQGLHFLLGRIVVKLVGMNESSNRSFGRTVVAALVVLVGVWLLLGVIGHVISFLFSTLILVVAVVAVVWALRVLL